uniref:Ubiquitin carboxyl-terminal hydrolase n=1 Tax=Angiostrongylus costaricensis TaxID=334426 RepID=A0A0R3PJ17_ANGCS
LRTIHFNSHDYSIVTQNLNGPCPLISVVNVLVLRGLLLTFFLLPYKKSLLRLGDASTSKLCNKGCANTFESNYDKNLEDVINLLPDLGRGLDVNIRFRNVTDFEFTPALSLFDLLRVNLYHGWLPDPQFVEITIGGLTYNQVVEQICDDDNVNRFLLQEFLNENVSQLTYHGLVSLSQAMHDGELAVLFRNNHFNTIYKRKDLLYLLVSDSGYVNEPTIVWESFNSVDGNSIFFASDFSFGSPSIVNPPEQGVCDTDSE